MAKIIIVLAVMSFVFVAKGQEATPQPADLNAALNEALQFSDVVIATVQKRIFTTVLPDDLKLAAEQILKDTKDGINECENQLKTVQLIWHYKVCASTQLRVSLSRISELEVEAAARNSTSSGATGTIA